MKFALFCLICKSGDTNIHFDGENGQYFLRCLTCGYSEKVVVGQPEPPQTHEDNEKLRKKMKFKEKQPSKEVN